MDYYSMLRLLQGVAATAPLEIVVTVSVPTVDSNGNECAWLVGDKFYVHPDVWEKVEPNDR